MSRPLPCLRLCTSSSCRSRGGEALLQSCRKVANAAAVTVKGVGCLGPCSEGPLLAIDAGDGSRLFGLVNLGDPSLGSPDGEQAGAIPALTASLQQVLQGRSAAALEQALQNWQPPRAIAIAADDPFLALQRRLVLERCGRIDPSEIDDALALGAYRQLAAVLERNAPAAVIALLRRSSLRGRGGAGYPTGLKWAAVAAMNGPNKVVVCNGDEGDPGAFMDRTVLEGDPHAVLEGMAIAAHAVGAQRGYLFVRAEYPLAIARLRRAIAQAEQHGWLGTAIGGRQSRFAVELRVGAGAYVCGEETALIRAIEGHRGTPRPRPPYPAEQGVFGLPTLINNVETFASIAPVLRLGPERYGCGTKVFSLSGQVRRSGVLEVPLGTSLRTIVDTMAGGAPSGRRIKAVLSGGPSGGCIPARALDTAMDDGSLQALGTILGSGGLVVLDETASLVEIAAFFMAFSREESCGKCIPCRAGTVQLDLLLRKLLAHCGSPADLAELERLCAVVSSASLCGLGQNAARPVLSGLRHFRDDYQALLPAAEEQGP